MNKKITYVGLSFLLLLSLSFLLLSQHSRNGINPACPGCSVVLVSVDALRADHLGVYGYFRNTSPAIDDFAGESIVFDNAYAQAPWTLPSHMSIFTSLYPSRHGVVSESKNLNDSTLTLADVLYAGGYKTAAFTGGGYVSHTYNYHTFEVFDDYSRNFDDMLSWLGDNSGERFFLFWHTYAVHCPYVPSTEFDVFSDKNYSGIVNPYPEDDSPLCNTTPAYLKRSCNRKCSAYYDKIMDNMSATDLDYVKAKYDSEILEVDDEFSRLVSLLRKKGLLDNTIIVFTSDHGESFAEREKNKRIGHDIMYDEVLRVPLIVRVPGLGRQIRVKNIVESVDIMPTVLSMLGFSPSDVLDGESLVSLILNRENKDYLHDEAALSENERASAIRLNNTKMIFSSDDDGDYLELYDLEADPSERSDISGLNKSLDDCMIALLFSKTHNETLSPRDVALDNRTTERLSELGYLA